MGYEVRLNRSGAFRILLEQRAEGTYVNVFESSNSLGPAHDWLQDDLEMAKRFCLQCFGVKEADWRQVPDEKWH